MSRPRKKPRQQRALATWTAILDAAAHLFAQHGYAGTTTNHIAERAGVSIGSLYQYFPNKDALLLALAERHIDEGTQHLRATLIALDAERPNLDGTLTRLLDATVSLHERDPAMHRLIFDQAPRLPETVARLRALEQFLAAAVAGHLLRLGVGGSSPMARALLLVQGIEAQIHGAVLAPPDGQPVGAIIEELRRLWLAALRGA